MKLPREGPTAMNEHHEKPMTTSQVAALLNLGTRTVRKRAEQDKLPGVKVGREWRFDAAKIRELATDSGTAPAA